MPMGLVNDDEFNAEVKNSSVDVTIKPMATPGRAKGDVAVPSSLQKIIGEQSVVEGRASAKEIARKFGISDSSVSAYANGATSTSSYNKPSAELVEHIEGRKARVVNTALSRLQRSLSMLDRNRMATASPREISAIAKDMASVVKMMEPPANNESPNSATAPQFVVYAPQIRDERHFGDVIQAKE